MADRENADRMGRRGFLQSLFGITAVTESATAQAVARAGDAGVNFFWCNLANGQIAFPTGMSVPSGQPGSIMKLVTAAALRESGLFTGDEKIECRGIVKLKGQSYKCLYPHGHVDLIKAIGLSCNVFFAQACQQLSPSAIVDYARKFGLDAAVDGYSGRCFPSQLSGDTTTYALGLAPDLQPNALQLMRLVAAVGLNGQVPPLHNAAEDAAAQQPFHLELQPGTFHALQQGMRIAERQGTAHQLDAQDTLKIAAKTGTAPHGKTFQSWVAGYFPFDQPKYAFCLRAAAGTSQDSAVPQARSFLFGAKWP